MLEKLFYNIGFLFTKIRFLRKKDLVQNFTTFLNEESRILIIMPFELGEFDEAKATMFSLKNEWDRLQISVVVPAQYLTYSGLAGHFNIFALTTKDINKFSLPKRKFLKTILAYEYDLVIDFNKVMDLTSSFISKRVDVKYRISFIKEHVDRFFNVQFNQDSVSDKKNIYSSLMSKLKLFCSKEIPKIENEKQDELNFGTEETEPENNKADTIKETKREKNNENKKQSKRERPERKGTRKKNG